MKRALPFFLLSLTALAQTGNQPKSSTNDDAVKHNATDFVRDLRGERTRQFGPPYGLAASTFAMREAAGKTVRLTAWIKTENVQNGYAGLWWRADGPGENTSRPVVTFDNSKERIIDGKPDALNGTIRGATGTTPWTLYKLELSVGKTASNINFGVLLTGTGTAWVDAIKVELDGQPYINSQVDFDFESPTARGFLFGCGSASANCTGYKYKVGTDDTVSYSGHRSLKMQYVSDAVAQK